MRIHQHLSLSIARAAATCAVALAVCAPALASSVYYNYAGNAFDTATSPYTTTDRLTGWIELSSLLGASSNNSLTPLAFSFSDGVDVLSNANASASTFDLISDSSGGIETWHIQVADINLPGGGGTMFTVSTTSDPNAAIFPFPVIGDSGQHLVCGTASVAPAGGP